ncbi:TPA: DUF551 domain-containing protein [Salmonella enterica]|uniref:DUF551 domain-containing protein n=1 Tax=Salmonella enterica TaxID=28901 RepID=UPI0006AC6473|nr:DUF551 domain-containing protein [Salmonella enterica]HCL5286520.1 DUF551 domain-containing protein [Salmonella enterica]
MTTITKEWLQQTIAEFENTRDDIPFGLSDDDAKILIVLKRALASLEAEPAGYHVIKECGKVGCSVATLEEAEKTRDFWNKKWTIRPYFYSAPPVQETGVYQDMLNIIGLLENNEWAEHCTSTVLGSLLESEITRLVGKKQPAPVVLDERADFKAWNNDVDCPLAGRDAKSAAWVAWNYRAMLQAGTLTNEGTIQAVNSPVIPGGWISCSERMPEQGAYISAVSKHGEYVAGQVIDDWLDLHDGTSFGLDEVYLWMMLPPLPASPQQ